MSKHTDGSWELFNLDSTTQPTEVGVRTNVGVDYLCRCYGNTEECKANARLIAAAPQMLAALKECAKQLAVMGATGHAEVARAAINKATGESS